MGTESMVAEAPSRMAHPIEAIDRIANLADELQERLNVMEERIGIILIPRALPSSPPVPKNPESAEPAPRSVVIERIENAEQKVASCVRLLNDVMARLDL